MKLLEYEAKIILKQAGLPVPEFVVVDPNNVSSEPGFPVVVKSQVPVGGRGKAGGVQVAENAAEFAAAVERISKLGIKGHLPRVLIAEQKLDIAEERYVALMIDRKSASIQLMAHAQGGMEVEDQRGFGSWELEVGKSNFTEIGREVADSFRTPEDAAAISDIIGKLYDCFVGNDATLLEINPLVRTPGGEYVCADAKMELDDAAAFRHPEWDFEDTPAEANFVTLDEQGEVATIANGAGLAMATVDAVAAYGMRPANFLDVGGGANKESVLKAFTRIMEYPHVHAIVINIFAGITRCDEVARAIIAARQEIDNLPPLFIRLAGTNFEAAAELLKPEEIPLQSTLEDCLAAAKQEIMR